MIIPIDPTELSGVMLQLNLKRSRLRFIECDEKSVY